MSYQTSRPRLRLQSPADVVSAVPYLLGFHPSDSVVVLGLRRAKLVFHVRADLLPREKSGPVETTEAARHLVWLLRVQAATGAIVVGYGEASRVTALALATASEVRGSGLTVIELMRVANGRYWCYECQDPACCPPEGHPVDIPSSLIAAQATLAGFTALPDRDALVKTLAAPAGPALGAAKVAVERARTRLAGRGDRDGDGSALTEAIRRYADGGRLTDDEIALLTVSLKDDTALRDEAWSRVDAPGSTISVHSALWTDVVCRCDPDLVVAPAVVLGYACWLLGDGVRAGIAIDRALAVDPECTAALLLSELLSRAVHPSVVTHVRRAIGSEGPVGERRRRSRRRSRHSRAAPGKAA